MTEAEKLAQILEGYGEKNSAALIREQEAKIKRMAEALRDSYMFHYMAGKELLEQRHADALRDAGVMP